MRPQPAAYSCSISSLEPMKWMRGCGENKTRRLELVGELISKVSSSSTTFEKKKKNIQCPMSEPGAKLAMSAAVSAHELSLQGHEVAVK